MGKIFSSSVLLTFFSFSLPVSARDPNPDPQLDEIVVTATLRRAPAIDVPASVTVLDRQTLRDAGRTNFEDVLGLIPNLNWAGDTSLPRYFQVRGIGELEQYQGAPNPSVGFLIDDVDFSGLGTAGTLYDIESLGNYQPLGLPPDGRLLLRSSAELHDFQTLWAPQREDWLGNGQVVRLSVRPKSVGQALSGARLLFRRRTAELLERGLYPAWRSAYLGGEYLSQFRYGTPLTGAMSLTTTWVSNLSP
jgi:hypothetical protein